MGRAALIESLRSKVTEDAAALWSDARARAEAYRVELAQALEQQRMREAAAAAALARKLQDDAFVAARHRAREIEARTALSLADRLYRLAVAELPSLRDRGGPELFQALARELPPRDWQRVRVNPGDREAARARFPAAEVECDPAICGGLEVESEAGRIRVSNTLETRLESAWPDLLPSLINDLRAKSHAQPTAP
jgi:V/A-type H+/Na+-transporting ATPase subunit E